MKEHRKNSSRTNSSKSRFRFCFNTHRWQCCCFFSNALLFSPTSILPHTSLFPSHIIVCLCLWIRFVWQILELDFWGIHLYRSDDRLTFSNSHITSMYNKLLHSLLRAIAQIGERECNHVFTWESSTNTNKGYCLYYCMMMYNQIWIIFGELSVFLTEQLNPYNKHDVVY